MNENHIKEHLSRDFLRLIAHRSGFSVDVSEVDYGSDATLTHYERIINPSGEISWCPSGQSMDAQLKCTTESAVVRKDEMLEYKLRVKNYNDLVRRKEKLGAVVPLCLILLILPDDSESWVNASKEQLLLSAKGYWYIPSDEVKLSPLKNDSKVKVYIPNTNLIQTDTIKQLFQELFS